jgi:hypothetical protein
MRERDFHEFLQIFVPACHDGLSGGCEEGFGGSREATTARGKITFTNFCKFSFQPGTMASREGARRALAGPGKPP